MQYESNDGEYHIRWRAFQRPSAVPRPRLQPVPLEIVMNLQEGETYERINIMGGNVPDDDDELLPVIFVTDRGTQFMALSRTMRYCRPIPQQGANDTGFTYMDIIRMASILQVTAPWLAVQLSSYEEFNGWDAGPHVADLANLYGLVNNGNNPAEAQAILSRVRAQVEEHAAINPMVQAVIERIVAQRADVVAQAVQAVVGRIVAQQADVAAQAVHTSRLILNCITVPDDEICTFCMETSADTQGMGWVSAEGCSSHRFHSNCIQRWEGGTCPTCRAPLLKSCC